MTPGLKLPSLPAYPHPWALFHFIPCARDAGLPLASAHLESVPQGKEAFGRKQVSTWSRPSQLGEPSI